MAKLELEYQVIMSTSNPNHLMRQVQQKLDAGWRLQGGVSVSSATGSGTPLFCQAVVRGGGE